MIGDRKHDIIGANSIGIDPIKVDIALLTRMMVIFLALNVLFSIVISFKQSKEGYLAITKETIPPT